MRVEIVGYDGSKGADGLTAYCNVHYMREGTPSMSHRPGKDGRSYFSAGGIVKVAPVSRSVLSKLDFNKSFVGGNGEAVISLDVRQYGDKMQAEIADIEYIS